MAVTQQDLIKLGKSSGHMQKAAFLGEVLGDVTYLGAMAPIALGGSMGYLADWATEPDEDDYERLRQKEKIELYRTLAAHANMRAERLMGDKEKKEEESYA